MDLAQPTPWVDFIGVDVAKSWIDSHRLSSGQRERGPACWRRRAASSGLFLTLWPAAASPIVW